MYGPIRLDHIVIYGLIIIIFVSALLFKIKFLKLSKVLLYPFIFLFLIIFFSTLINNNWTEFSFVLATFDNYIQPIAIITIFSVLLSYQEFNFKLTIEKILNLIVFLLCINTLLIILTAIFDFQFLNKLYEIKFDAAYLENSDDPSSQSVKARSMTMGRYLGVFNQPIASGSAYLTSFICWLYLSINSKGLALTKIISLTLILIGGAASVSKVFILGFPLISLIYLLSCLFINRLPKFHIYIFNGYLLVLPLMIFILSFTNWRGFDFFMRFFKYENYQGTNKLDNVIIATIEGRFEKESGTMIEIIKMLDTNLFFGYGVTEMRVFDSGFFEIILGTGLIGMLIFLFILFYLLIMSLKSILKKNINGVLLFCLIISTIATSLGGQPFQLNRSSSILIIVILAFMTIIKGPKKSL